MAKTPTPRSTPARPKAKPRAAKPAPARAKAAPATGFTETLRRNAFPLAGAVVAGAAAAAALFFTRNSNGLPEGHAAPDLEGDAHPGPDDRADPHFRPDMDSPLTAEDRAALEPALGRPSLVANG